MVPEVLKVIVGACVSILILPMLLVVAEIDPDNEFCAKSRTGLAGLMYILLTVSAVASWPLLMV